MSEPDVDIETVTEDMHNTTVQENDMEVDRQTPATTTTTTTSTDNPDIPPAVAGPAPADNPAPGPSNATNPKEPRKLAWNRMIQLGMVKKLEQCGIENCKGFRNLRSDWCDDCCCMDRGCKDASAEGCSYCENHLCTGTTKAGATCCKKRQAGSKNGLCTMHQERLENDAIYKTMGSVEQLIKRELKNGRKIKLKRRVTDKGKEFTHRKNWNDTVGQQVDAEMLLLTNYIAADPML